MLLPHTLFLLYPTCKTVYKFTKNLAVPSLTSHWCCDVSVAGTSPLAALWFSCSVFRTRPWSMASNRGVKRKNTFVTCMCCECTPNGKRMTERNARRHTQRYGLPVQSITQAVSRVSSSPSEDGNINVVYLITHTYAGVQAHPQTYVCIRASCICMMNINICLCRQLGTWKRSTCIHARQRSWHRASKYRKRRRGT